MIFYIINKTRYLSLLLIFVLHSGLALNAQPDLSAIKNVDSTLVDYIRTAKLSPSNNAQFLPIIPMKGTLTLGFDDLYGDYMDYYYTVYHCTKDWEMTDVERSRYLIGRDQLEIEQFAHSAATNQLYYHYSVTFPNRDMNLVWSGNYMLVVYDVDDTVVLTKRFYIVENEVAIETKRVRPLGPGEHTTHQAMNLTLDVAGLNARNPIEDISVYAWQNYFNESGIQNLQGDYMQGTKMKFNNQKSLNFLGYKEYRYFDLRTTEIAGQRVNLIELNDNSIDVLLELEKDRRLKSNFSEFDINGGFFIDNRDPNARARDPNYTSEYANVTFSLQLNAPSFDDVYVLGEFNDYKAHETYKMAYLEEHRSYFVEAPMKQGYYNYFYAVQREDGKMDIFQYEGSSFETENHYIILAYYSPIEFDYDRIVGYSLVELNGRL